MKFRKGNTYINKQIFLQKNGMQKNILNINNGSI